MAALYDTAKAEIALNDQIHCDAANDLLVVQIGQQLLKVQGKIRICVRKLWFV